MPLRRAGKSSYKISSDYLDQFESETEEVRYNSFSDFFLRKYKQPLNPQGNIVWPCEGYVCDWGLFSKKNNSVVKGHTLVIFEITDSQNRPWSIAMVGGFGVGTIEVTRELLNGGNVKIGQKIESKDV